LVVREAEERWVRMRAWEESSASRRRDFSAVVVSLLLSWSLVSVVAPVRTGGGVSSSK
jgi:hypothetical protein